MDQTRRDAIHTALVRLSDGDRAAFPALVDELWPVILAFVQGSVGQAADAEDVAQEVFLRICARISAFDRSRDGLSWVFCIAGYEGMTRRRRIPRRREGDGTAALPALAVAHAAGALSDDDRRALGLDEACGSVVAGPTLRKRRQRALDRLRDVWRRVHGGS